MTDSSLDSSHEIPAAAFRRSLANRHAHAAEAMRRVLSSGQLILGTEVSDFETEFAAFTGTQHAVGVASGTDALILALRALEIGPEDEVICVANGPVPTVAAIRAVGATPRFVDVDSGTLQLDVNLVEMALTTRTRCLLPVHLYGCPVDLDPLVSLAESHNLKLIEDCAQAHGARYGNRPVGTSAAIGCFSFYPTKNLAALGDAGACITNDPNLDQRLRELRMYGFRGRAIAEIDGMNSRLDELQAALLRPALAALPAALQQRSEHAAAYLSGLNSDLLRLPNVTARGTAAWHQFVIRSPNRDAIQRLLREDSILCGIHYAWPVHLMPAYKDPGDGAPSLPVTEQACDEVLSLPILPELTSDEISRVIDAVNRTALQQESHSR